MIKQLQRKFVLSAMLAISILLLVVLGGVNIFNAIYTDKKTDKLLSTLAQVENSAVTMMLPEVRSSWDFFSTVVTQDDTLGAIYFVVREDSHRIVRSFDTSHISSISRREAENLVENVQYEDSGIGRMGRFKYIILPTVGNLGKTYIFLEVSEQTNSVWQVLFLSVGVGILCWVCMLLFVILLSKKAIRPIAENIEKQKQFVTDAGHEIKTPLAIIMANADALELHYGENKYSQNIKGQIFRLKGLTQDMLSLAKMEEQPNKKKKENFSMTELVAETVGQFAAILEEKETDLDLNLMPNLCIQSAKEDVRKLLSILVDNAVKYSLPGGKIEISLTYSGKQIFFEISNTCENLDTLQLNRIFDRFYRGDNARTQKSGGYGSGLSAALAIVKSLGGTITVERKSNDKINFCVKFPTNLVSVKVDSL